LPFINLDGSKEEDYLADGLAEQLTDVLSRVEGLRVVSRTSSFRFRDRGADPRQIGKALNVDTLLEGSGQKTEGHIRVVAHLTHGQGGFHSWSGPYDHDLDPVIAVEEKLAKEIVTPFRFSVPNRDELSMGLRYPANSKAYDLYLKGLYAYDRGSKEGL